MPEAPSPLRIGSLSVFPVLDGLAMAPIEPLYNRYPTAANDGRPGKTLEDWNRLGSAHLLDECMPMAFGGYLVLGSADRVILIDTGFGGAVFSPYKDEWNSGIGTLPASLAALGYQPEDVTDVVFTHLHTDHVGWASVEGEPFFTNATYRADVADWNHFYGPDERLTPILAGFIERLEAFDGDARLLPGISTRRLSGHTPGTNVLTVADGAESVAFVGDIAHTPVEFEYDDWAELGDVEPNQAREDRNTLAAELCDSGAYIAGGHFARLGIGMLVSTESGRAWYYMN